ncbi:3'-5' exonuclease [Marinisporobacter balticus]|uniref:DNA polymerase-3 subunit epsilon n=1 Tax=Marinisporobacter balticus TaxID=2018667 RepID=A0A4R2KHD3_9FIRM|nr:3'-5' exonuclease [Marinisporobacter balticus]TCO71842.1 DNA polymerase-3 subunit epsilon [Marinisporobacter balticus]
MYDMNEEYIVVDIETTGLSYKNGAEIIEVGAVKIVDGKILERRGSLIRFHGEMDPFAFKAHGITREMTKDQPNLEEVLPRIRKYIGDNIVVCHNAKFDVPFMNHYFKKLDLPLIDRSICTLKALTKLKKEGLYKGINNKLDAACAYYGIELKNYHRASWDAKATAELFLKIAAIIDRV